MRLYFANGSTSLVAHALKMRSTMIGSTEFTTRAATEVGRTLTTRFAMRTNQQNTKRREKRLSLIRTSVVRIQELMRDINRDGSLGVEIAHAKHGLKYLERLARKAP